MNETSMDKLVQRLDRLERENRWLKILGLLVVVALSLSLLTGATKSERSKIVNEVRARRFVLVDGDNSFF